VAGGESRQPKVVLRHEELALLVGASAWPRRDAALVRARHFRKSRPPDLLVS